MSPTARSPALAGSRPVITFTAAALEGAQRRVAASGQSGGGQATVRVSLTDGGCAGRKYELTFGEPLAAGDAAWQQHGLTVVCRHADLAELKGLHVDFVRALMGGGFRFENPNAATTCGCGDSFAPRPPESADEAAAEG